MNNIDATNSITNLDKIYTLIKLYLAQISQKTTNHTLDHSYLIENSKCKSIYTIIYRFKNQNRFSAS